MGPVKRFRFAIYSLVLGIVLLHDALGQHLPVPRLITGTCVGVLDGDTIEVEAQGQRFRVRLHGIDSPETDQPGATDAKKFAESLVLGRQVSVRGKQWDQYQRLVGRVFHDVTDIGVKIVQNGHAWHYAEFSNDAVLADAQREAQFGRRGLWREPDQVPPWEWRAGNRGDVVRIERTPIVMVGIPPTPHRDRASHGASNRLAQQAGRATTENQAAHPPCQPQVWAEIQNVYQCSNDHYCVKVEMTASTCCRSGRVNVRLFYEDRQGPRLQLARDTSAEWSMADSVTRMRVEVDTFVYARVNEATGARAWATCSDH